MIKIISLCSFGITAGIVLESDYYYKDRFEIDSLNTCSQNTGGTCAWLWCDSSRGSYCDNDVCVCAPGQCARDGKCHDQCGGNQHVQGNACVSCPAGTTNAYGDDASGADTTCDAIKCSANQRVVAHACQVCPAGTTKSAGDDASGDDTTCDAIHCAKNQYVKLHACHTCPAGMTNAAGDDASKEDTTCDRTLCAANKKVVSNECVGCPAGKSNTKDDDASGGDSVCDAIKCGENQHVHDNACVSCPALQINSAGDDASGTDTTCTCATKDTGGTCYPYPLNGCSGWRGWTQCVGGNYFLSGQCMCLGSSCATATDHDSGKCQ